MLGHYGFFKPQTVDSGAGLANILFFDQIEGTEAWGGGGGAFPGATPQKRGLLWAQLLPQWQGDYKCM